MAGILITIGPEAKKIHKNLLEVFTKVKDLYKSGGEISQFFSISKFFRKNGIDTNIFQSKETKIWAIGSVIYRRNFGNKALVELEKDLSRYDIDRIVDDLDGHFFLVIQKPKLKRVWIITDHAGIVNVYRYISDTTMIISSSALALSKGLSVTPNKNAICQFLRNAFICDLDTIYHEIELLEPGTIYHLECEPKFRILSKKKYWESPKNVDERLTFEAAQERLSKQLVERAGIMAGENLITDLSAGFDSRLNASVLAEVRKFSEGGDLPTFVFGPTESKEVNLVKDICAHVGLKNHHLVLPYDWAEKFAHYTLRSFGLTDGEENICTYAPMLYANEYKAQNSDLCINGLGGELYRDQPWIHEVICDKKTANYDRLVKTRILQYEYNYNVFSAEWRKDMLGLSNVLKKKFIDTNADMDLKDTYNTIQIDSIYLKQKMRRWAGRTISTTNQLIRSVAPLMLKKCLEAGMTIPPRYKRNGKLVRAIVESLNPKLAEEKMLNGTPCQNFRINNFYKFFPLIPDLSKRFARKISQKAFGRTIFLDKTLTYPMTTWYKSIFSDPKMNKFLKYEDMITRNIYDKIEFNEFLKRAKLVGFPYYHQLGNILTLELRMEGDNCKTEFTS